MCGWQRYRTFVVAASSGGSPQSPAYSRACLLDAACLFSFSCPIWFVLCSGTYILYFGLLLDTTSRVSNFSPSPDKDVSLKRGVPFEYGKALFPPIYAIDSMDIYVESNSEHVTTTGRICKRSCTICTVQLFRM